MADLGQRIEELRRQVVDVAKRSNTSDVSAEVSRLERAARDLLAEAKNTAYESQAQSLFAEIARIHAPTSQTTATVRGLVRRARIRIEIAGDEDDIDDAIDILAEALALNPADADTIALLQDAVNRTPSAAQRVGDLFRQHGVDQSARGAERPPEEPRRATGESRRAENPFTSKPDDAPPPRIPSEPSTGYRPPEQDAPRPRSGEFSDELDALISDLSQSYYAGEYRETVEIANRILSIQPNNAAAKDYRDKAEDNLIRGVVPDHRIPFDARVSFNRANSLVRAGNYEDAERLYREARDLAERSGILTWKDAEQALLDIQDLALARELLSDGDRLMAADHWSDAIRKYEGALRVVPNDPQAEERLDIARRVQQDADQVAVQINMIGGSLKEQAAQLQTLLATIARARQSLPNSQRLASLQNEAKTRMDALKNQVADQSQAALSRAQNATSLDEKLLLSHEALRLLELGVELDPGDSRLSGLMSEVRAMSGEMQRGKQMVERAASMIAQNFDGELAQARGMLAELSDHAQDERYRITVNELFSRYMERAEIAMEEGDLKEAQGWIDTMHEEPFRMVGRRAELMRLENQVRGQRFRNRGIVAGSIFGIFIIVALLGLITRPQWEPIINPPTATITPTPSDTATPSITPTWTLTFTPTSTPSETPSSTSTLTPTWTVTPSLTITPSETPTHTNTPTHTPTPTSTPTETTTSTPTETPTITPTPLEMCIVETLTGRWWVRAEPDTNATEIALLNGDERLNVYGQHRDDGDFVWYLIEIHLSEDTIVRGWIRSDGVRAVGDRECPPAP